MGTCAGEQPQTFTLELKAAQPDFQGINTPDHSGERSAEPRSTQPNMWCAPTRGCVEAIWFPSGPNAASKKTLGHATGAAGCIAPRRSESLI